MITVVYKLKIKSHLIVLLEQFQHARRHQRLLDGLLLAILSSDGLGFCDISEWHGDRFMARKEDLGVINVGNLIQRNYPYTQVRLSIPIKSVVTPLLLHIVKTFASNVYNHYILGEALFYKRNDKNEKEKEEAHCTIQLLLIKIK